MGGETRPEIQGEIFQPGYAAGTEYKQDFMQCVDVTHATYMFHHNAFVNGQPYTGSKLDKALDAHVGMGYNYEVKKVAAKNTGNGKVTIDVTVEQTGVAPFYYDLDLVLSCDGTTEAVGGVEGLIATGDSKVFSFSTLPADSQCLDNIEILLRSDRVYETRPVRFAQGNGRVTLSVPVPQSGRDDPISDPVPPPVSPPVKPPVSPPVTAPGSSPINPENADVFVNTGPENEDLSIISGSHHENYAQVEISKPGVFGQDVYRTHRWGSAFTYTFDELTPGAAVDITLGFAETYGAACSGTISRVFDIAVNAKSFATSLNVFAKTGCNSAYKIKGEAKVNSKGEVAISFTTKSDNAMISFIQIDEKGSDTPGQSSWLAMIVQIIVSIVFGFGK